MDQFDEIISDNYEEVLPASSADYAIRNELIEMKKKPTPLDGIIVLVLLASSVGLLVWALTDFGWDTVRLTGAWIFFTLSISYSSHISKGN